MPKIDLQNEAGVEEIGRSSTPAQGTDPDQQ